MVESGSKAAQSPAGRRAWIVVQALSCAAMLGGFAYYETRRRATEDELARNRGAIEAAKTDADRRIADLRREAEDALAAASRSVEAARETARTSTSALKHDLDLQGERLAVQQKLLDDFECRHESSLGRARTDFEESLKKIADRVDADRSRGVSTADRFRAIQRRADSAVFLVHCAFGYEVKEDDKWIAREATAWGTGFLVGRDGLLVTNKHLVQPWKFDADLAAMRAMGELRVKEDSVKLAAWPVGEVCLDLDKKPLFENGFNTERGDLAFVCAAPDRNVPRSAETFKKTIEFETHALDDHDLAILWVAGGPYEPLDLASEADERALKKLDPVMTLGFPRGNTGLESSVAESSASLGVVRKIENTIQITAPIIAGNSGGPLIDERGKVVGVATRIFSETLGICIKAGRVRDLLADAESTRLGYAAFVPSKK